MARPDRAQSHLAQKTEKLRLRRLASRLIVVLAAYVAVAYFIIPWGWEHYARRHPAFDANPRLTSTRDGHPGDPTNVALVGSRQQVHAIMAAAKWFEANRLGVRSDIDIAADTVLDRVYDQAPVSNLYLFGRPQDLAFEQPVGDSPRRRNHVRFWQTAEPDDQGRQVWIGAASYDERVGFSETTGQVTHHIAPDVDTERDRLSADLETTGMLADAFTVPGFHTMLEGRNGGGDAWRTDGSLWAGVIAPAPD